VRRRAILLGTAAILAVPSIACATTTAATPSPRPSIENAAPASAAVVPSALRRFFQYTRPATYDTVKLQIQVPMRDGVHLGCYLYVPATLGTTTPAPGRFPGIIDNFTPYYLAYPAAHFNGQYFSRHGYLDLECTPRGVGTSGGRFPGWLSALENRDNYDLIEWLAHQPNSNGKVAQEGDSYGGMTAYRVAALHPPHLVTIAPQQSYASMYLDYSYPGGIRSLGDPDWYLFTGGVGVVRPMLSIQEKRWLAHPLLDAYWQQIDIAPKWNQITVPILGFGGWLDLFQDGMVRNYLGLKGPNTYLINGPWTHGSTFDSTVTLGALLAWFDHWMYGDPRAPMPPTHVASYVMPSGPWQALADWPPAGTHAQTLGFTTSGALAAEPGKTGNSSYVVNTGAGLVDLRSGDHLTFAGLPLPTTQVIRGAGTVRLVATLTDPTGSIAATQHGIDTSRLVDTNFVFHLYDVTPAGAKRLITRGYLKASQYTSHTYPTRLPLGQAVEYDIPLWQVDYRIAANDHLELLLESGEQECCQSAAPAASQPLFPLTVTVATGRGGSSLTLRVD
jgi:predicted acyl esterase